jgi:hypothetical protein
MTPLFIGEEELKEIERVKAYAQAHRMNKAELQRRIDDPSIPPVGDAPGYRCRLPMGFLVAFSIEEQPEPLSWCRHISVSVNKPERAPNVWAMELIGKAFGFEGDFMMGVGVVYVAEGAVQVIQPIDQPEERMRRAQLPDSGRGLGPYRPIKK